jgi:TyrR family helix-turn-helix protein
LDNRSDKCRNCNDYIKDTKITWPTSEELKKLVWEYPSSVLAEKLGVSDVAISKRCKRYGIDKPPRGYWRKMATGNL